MRVWTNLEAWQLEVKGRNRPIAITIGNFDGIHWGHRELLKAVQNYVQKNSGMGFLLTFDPHPLQILAPEKKHIRLFSLKDQQEVVSEFALDGIIRQPFSREFSQISASDFLQDYILKKIQARFIAVGENFQFGSYRSGNRNLLQSFASKNAIELIIQSPVLHAGEVVSTSAIRKYLVSGEPEKAANLLGRRYYLQGLVEKGEGRGRALGFPTANIRPEVDFLPRQGVYICDVRVVQQSQIYKAVMNIGTNRTFHEGDTMPFKFEIHLLDFRGDLYGQKLKVELIKYIRAERKFESKDSLKIQIDQDVAFARKYYEEN